MHNSIEYRTQMYCIEVIGPKYPMDNQFVREENDEINVLLILKFRNL